MIKIRVIISFLLFYSLSIEVSSQFNKSITEPSDTIKQDSISLNTPLETIELTLEEQVDSIIHEGIRAEAFPGCVVFASHSDSILFFKAYGFHTYDSLKTVKHDDIYDLASITKVTGATLALMKLYESGLFHLDDQIGEYIDGLGKVGRVTIRECLAHQAGLYPWIPYYQEVRKKNGKYKNKTFGKGEGYTYRLNKELSLHEDFYSKIKRMIKSSDLSDTKDYKYSGLFFYLVPEMVQKLAGISYDEFLTRTFYQPLNAPTLTFNPLLKFDSSVIVPTENDTYFRMQQIHGAVHDEGAITMRGVSGNAGLFGNAMDLSKIWKMLLNRGRSDTTKFLNPETIELFTTTQYPNNDNRRGLGFDKPLLDYDSIRSSVAKDASYRSYGHTGYTGTLVWADPDKDLLFIFLSNRVYPTRENRNIYNLNIRPRIHQLLYEQIKKDPRK